MSARLIVELDGGHHFDEQQMGYDTRRTKWLEERGYRVIRVTNFEITKHPLDALDAIHRALQTPPSAR